MAEYVSLPAVPPVVPCWSRREHRKKLVQKQNLLYHLCMKPRILCAWLGKTDIRAAWGETEVGTGPILQALKAEDYAAVILLSNYPKTESETYLRWLEKSADRLEVILKLVDLSSPTEYAEIYEHAHWFIEEFLLQRPRCELTFHLSPGTPAMAATWILMAGGKHQARLIETSREMGVREVSLPFEILAEYRPKYGRRIDDQILSISDEMLPDNPAFDTIIHQSQIMKDTVNMARRAARFDVPLLFLGESGTGKELFARAVHAASSRADGPFIAVNCGALPAGLVESELFGYAKGAFTGAAAEKTGYIEEAHGGTLFLDEVGELPLEVQVLLLRVLNDSSFHRVGSTKKRSSDFRLISATNRSLLSNRGGDFRDDLFYRIAVGVIHVPPLRKRGKDIHLLVDHFLADLNEKFSSVSTYKKKQIGVGARKVLLDHFWPGNVRELINALTRVCLWSSGERIGERVMKQFLAKGDAEDLLPERARTGMNESAAAVSAAAGETAAPDSPAAKDYLQRPLGRDFNLDTLLEEIRRHYIYRALDEAAGVKAQAARLLGLPNYQSLSYWIDKYEEERENRQKH